MNQKEYKEILTENILPEISCAYITESSNLSQFIQCVLKDKSDWVFDYAEILDCDYPFQINEYVQTDKHVKISFGFGYILTLWHKKNQLARVTAFANGILLSPAKMPNEWECLDWDKLTAPQIRELGRNVEIQLNNIEEEYDDTSFL